MNLGSPQQYEPIVLVNRYDVTKAPLNLRYKLQAHLNYSIQIVCTGLDKADAVVKVQQSNDPDLGFDDHPTFSWSPGVGSSSHSFVSTVPLGTAWLNVNLVKGTNTTGTVTVILQINK